MWDDSTLPELLLLRCCRSMGRSNRTHSNCSVLQQVLSYCCNFFVLQIRDLPHELISVNSLVAFLTRFLWQISAHHAAINYPMADYGGFTLNMPTKLYRDSRVSDDVFSLFNFPNANISAVGGILVISCKVLTPFMFAQKPPLTNKTG